MVFVLFKTIYYTSITLYVQNLYRIVFVLFSTINARSTLFLLLCFVFDKYLKIQILETEKKPFRSYDFHYR